MNFDWALRRENRDRRQIQNSLFDIHYSIFPYVHDIVLKGMQPAPPGKEGGFPFRARVHDGKNQHSLTPPHIEQLEFLPKNRPKQIELNILRIPNHQQQKKPILFFPVEMF